MLEKATISLCSYICTQFQQCPIGVFLIIAACVSVYKLAIFPFLISPLRHVPGPYWHRVSSLPNLHLERTNQRNRRVYQLHEIYGNVVILSPTSISCNGDPKYVNDICVKNMPRSNYYANFKLHGEVNMFAELSNKMHLHYKKVIANLYLRSAILGADCSARTILMGPVKRLVRQVQLASNQIGNVGNIPATGAKSSEVCGGDRTDTEMYTLFGALAIDAISAFELGAENGSNLLESKQRKDILSKLTSISDTTFWFTRLPKLWNWVVGKDVKEDAKAIEEWQLNLYEKAEKNAPSSLSSLEAFRAKGICGRRAYSNLSDNLVAGHSTVANQLTYLCYQLSRPVNKVYQKRLMDEIEEAFGRIQDSPQDFIDDFHKVESLTFLDALMNETLRLHAASGPIYRVTDRSYAVDIDTHGCNWKKSILIPAGIEISCLSYSMHRVTKVFANPEKWDPNRWLQSPSESHDECKQRVREMQRYMLPFGKGVRMCLGLNLGTLLIKMTMANLYWRFSLDVSSEWCRVVPKEESGELKAGSQNASLENDETRMTMTDAFGTRPFYSECFLQWTPL